MMFFRMISMLILCTVLVSCSPDSEAEQEQEVETEVPDTYIPEEKPSSDGRQRDLENLSGFIRTDAFFAKLKEGYVFPYSRSEDGSTVGVLSYINASNEIKLTTLDCNSGKEGFTIKLPAEGSGISEQVLFHMEETLRTNKLIKDSGITHLKLSESFKGPNEKMYKLNRIEKWNGHYVTIEELDSGSSWLIGSASLHDTLTLTQYSSESSSKLLLAKSENGTSLESFIINFDSLLPERRIENIETIVKELTADGKLINGFMRHADRAYLFATPSATGQGLYRDWVIVDPNYEAAFFADSEGIRLGNGELISNEETNGYYYSLSIVNDNGTVPPSIIVDQYIKGLEQLDKSFVFSWNTFMKRYEQVK